MGYLASGKLLKVGVEFSLEDPQGGIHFVVPEGLFIFMTFIDGFRAVVIQVLVLETPNEKVKTW